MCVQRFVTIAACNAKLLKYFQEGFQKFLLIIALMCIPVMLLSKPILMRQQHLKGGIAQVCSCLTWHRALCFLSNFKQY